MVAIAKELSAVGVTKAEVILAVGLPFSDYGREKKELIGYYEQKPILKNEYEGIRYDITTSKVFVFPQCYSAIAQRYVVFHVCFMIPVLKEALYQMGNICMR